MKGKSKSKLIVVSIATFVFATVLIIAFYVPSRPKPINVNVSFRDFIFTTTSYTSGRPVVLAEFIISNGEPHGVIGQPIVTCESKKKLLLQEEIPNNVRSLLPLGPHENRFVRVEVPSSNDWPWRVSLSFYNNDHWKSWLADKPGWLQQTMLRLMPKGLLKMHFDAIACSDWITNVPVVPVRDAPLIPP